MVKVAMEGGTPPGDILRRFGVAGEELFQKFERAKARGLQLEGQLADALRMATRRLNGEDKRFITTNGGIFIVEDQVPASNERVRRWVDAWRAASRRIGELAEAAEMHTQTAEGGWRPFQRRLVQTYVPHVLTLEADVALRNRTGPVWEALERDAKARGIPIEKLYELSQRAFAEKRQANLEHERTASLPRTVRLADGSEVKVLEDSPEILAQHIRGAAKRIAIVEEFGNESVEQELAEEADALVRAAVGRPELAAMVPGADVEGWVRHTIPAMWQHAQGADRWRQAFPGRRRTQAAWSALEAATAASNLSLAVIPNVVGGFHAEAVRMGVPAAVREVVHAYTTSIGSGSEIEIRQLANLNQDISVGLAQTERLEGLAQRAAHTVLEGTGFGVVNRKINFGIAAGMIRSNLPTMLEAIRTGKVPTLFDGWSSDRAVRYLVEELGFSRADVGRMVLEGPTELDRSRAATKQVELVNAINESPTARPPWINSPLWRIFVAYSTYVRKFARTTQYATREAFLHDNWGPLARLLLLGVPTGEAIRALRDWFKDREREDDEDPFTPAGLALRVARDLMEVGTLGLAGQIDYAVRHMGEPGHNLAWDVLAPPPVEFLGGLVGAAVQSVGKESLRPVWRWVTRVAPLADVAAKQAPRLIGAAGGDQVLLGETAARLESMVYLGHGTSAAGEEYWALDPHPDRRNTANRLRERLREAGFEDGDILEAVRSARDRRVGRDRQ